MTAMEVLIGVFILVIGLAGFFRAIVSQTVLNEHSRNFTLAMNDSRRVLERIRQQNTSDACVTPSALPPQLPVAYLSWDAWLADLNGGGGKSIRPDSNELIAVTCQKADNSGFCGAGDDPIHLTIAVCWRHRSRTIGDCTWNGNLLIENNPGASGDPNVVNSPAQLQTVMSCRR
ncbi:MAG: hypothetical protein HY737_04285 [Candidatus Omnitrophica bacterium]|nr:hypothetical protein [Candidatus Omnitrophota bacterium]